MKIIFRSFLIRYFSRIKIDLVHGFILADDVIENFSISPSNFSKILDTSIKYLT